MTLRLTAGSINTFINDQAIGTFLEQHLSELTGVVVDIGCGRMKYKHIIESGTHVEKYIGLDLKPGAFTDSYAADVYWDGLKMPFENNSVDGAILFEVLEHCEKPDIVLTEAYRVLKPGGALLISTPFLYQLHGSPHDFQRFTPFGLSSKLIETGFSKNDIQLSGGWDASLAQMIGIWIQYRPMPSVVRKILRYVFIPLGKLLLFYDKKHYQKTENNLIAPGLLGIAYK